MSFPQWRTKLRLHHALIRITRGDQVTTVAMSEGLTAASTAGLTVERIAEAAEVSPSTFFRYFRTKNDVVLQDGIDALVLEASGWRAIAPGSGRLRPVAFGWPARSGDAGGMSGGTHRPVVAAQRVDGGEEVADVVVRGVHGSKRGRDCGFYPDTAGRGGEHIAIADVARS